MWKDRSFWLAAGVAVGLFGARALQPGESREFAKSLLTGSMRLHDWLLLQYELVREDLEDLYAEARAAYESEKADASTQPQGRPSADAERDTDHPAADGAN